MFELAAAALAGGGALASIFGASKAAEAQKNIIAGERAVEGQRKKAMELDSRRKMLEIVRNQQRARAMALTTATAQGAQNGSGLMGGYGQISGQTGTNLLGVGQNLAIGRNIFGINSQISQAKMDMADAQSWSAIGSALTGVGGQFLGNAGAMSRLSGQLRSSPAPASYSGLIYGPGY